MNYYNNSYVVSEVLNMFDMYHKHRYNNHYGWSYLKVKCSDFSNNPNDGRFKFKTTLLALYTEGGKGEWLWLKRK